MMLAFSSEINLLESVQKVEKNQPFHIKFLVEGGYLKAQEKGIYVYNVLGSRVINKIQALLRTIFYEYSCYEVIFPFVQSKGKWEKSGRLDKYQDNIAFLGDNYLVSPSYEEISDYLLLNDLSYKRFPQSHFAFSHCFREELRPKNGLMRTNEFLLFHGYSYSIDREQYNFTYNNIKNAMSAFFKAINLPVNLAYFKSYDQIEYSEEFVVECGDLGEARLNYCPACSRMYRASQFKICDCGVLLETKKAVECADIIKNAEYFSVAFDKSYRDCQNNKKHYYMVAFGLGLSKLLAVLLENKMSNFFWPENIAPYKYVLIPSYKIKKDLRNLVVGNKEDFLIDNRDLSIDNRINSLKSLGFPNLLISDDLSSFRFINNITKEERVIYSLDELC